MRPKSPPLSLNVICTESLETSKLMPLRESTNDNGCDSRISENDDTSLAKVAAIKGKVSRGIFRIFITELSELEKRTSVPSILSRHSIGSFSPETDIMAPPYHRVSVIQPYFGYSVN